MKRAIIIIICCLMSGLGYCQVDRTLQPGEEPQGRYLFGEFTTGIGKLHNGRRISDRFNYDVVNQEMHFRDGYEVMKLEMPELDTLFVGNRVFVQNGAKFAECFKLQNGIELQVLWHAREIEKGKKGVYGTTTQAGGVFNIYVSELSGDHAYQDQEKHDLNTYVYQLENTYIITINKKKSRFKDAKSLAKVLKRQEDEITSLMKENKWSFANAKDICEMVSGFTLESCSK